MTQRIQVGSNRYLGLVAALVTVMVLQAPRWPS